MVKVTNYTYQMTQEGERVSYTYSEVNEEGDILSSNNKKNFIVTDAKLSEHLKAVKTYLEGR